MGPDAAFISAGGYHHHIGLNTWQSRGGSPPPPGTTGLFHAAIRYPTRRALADALGGSAMPGSRSTARPTMASARRSTYATPIRTGSSSTGTVPASEWPHDPADPDSIVMYTRPLDVRGLLAELDD